MPSPWAMLPQREVSLDGLLALKAASETLCAAADAEYRKVEAVISDLETEVMGERSRAALLRTQIESERAELDEEKQGMEGVLKFQATQVRFES